MAYPQFQAPKWQTSRISALRQKFAAPQVGRLKRQMGGMMGMGYDPQSIQARRATIRGYGEGLGGIMGAAGQSALSQYGQEYGKEFEAAGIQHATAERESEREWARPGYADWMKTGRKPIGLRRGMSSAGMGYAKGGNITRAKPYLVGEEGPELFVPDTKGTIIPNPETQRKMKSKSLYISRQQGGSVRPPSIPEWKKEEQRKRDYATRLMRERTQDKAGEPFKKVKGRRGERKPWYQEKHLRERILQQAKLSAVGRTAKKEALKLYGSKEEKLREQRRLETMHQRVYGSGGGGRQAGGRGAGGGRGGGVGSAAAGVTPGHMMYSPYMQRKVDISDPDVMRAQIAGSRRFEGTSGMPRWYVDLLGQRGWQFRQAMARKS